MRVFELIKDAIEPMRYDTGFNKFLYWFIKIGSIALVILIILIIAGLIYCKVNGIEIVMPF